VVAGNGTSVFIWMLCALAVVGLVCDLTAVKGGVFTPIRPRSYKSESVLSSLAYSFNACGFPQLKLTILGITVLFH
jgi:hypothetical protein